MKQIALTLFLSLSRLRHYWPINATPVATGTNSASPFTDERQQASYALGMMICHIGSSRR